MTLEQIEIELKYLATKGELAELRAEMHKEFAALTRTIWLTQLSTIGIILVGVGLLIHFKL
jgi:hypothetical protein